MENLTKEEIVEIVKAAITHQPPIPVKNEERGFLSSAKNVVITLFGAAIIGVFSVQYARNDTSLRFEVKMETQYESLVDKLDNLLSKYDEVQKELHDRTADRITNSAFKEEIMIRDSRINSLENSLHSVENKFRELEFIIKSKHK
ncbi:hypothetical protein ACE193_15140 [Bernardetia sp. OM2101]|uniref:hypothetical protein n=1 Tax=Bernardetia sp. OM2101 TaxID=3344876 RepID=UPI0035D0158D